MTPTIQCHICGVVLNLPPNALGKRLKCPKCGTKLVAGQGNTRAATERSDHDASPASSQDIPRGHGDVSLPTAAGDLRETFDLPLLTEAAAPAAPAKAPVADALALFEEKKTAPRRPNAAEARAKARRCPTCGGVVPVGMSICSTCGLDLESGTRVALDDDLAPEAPARPSGPPIGVSVIANVSLLGSLILAVYSGVKWMKGGDGWQYFIPVCLFGAFSAFHLLRGHTAKLLIAALTLGAVIDVVALIAMPIYVASVDTQVIERTQTDDPEAPAVAIRSTSEELDTQRIALGIALLMTYAAVSVYLVSPAVRRHYAKA